MTAGALGLWTVPIAVLGGAIRVSTPFLFVSLGELVTEKSGRINLGLEGTLIMGAMSGFAVAYLTGSPWLGVLAAGVVGMAFGALHAGVCSLPRVNDIAVGIALMLLGTGLAFYLGKPLVQPRAPTLPALPLGFLERHSAGARRARSQRPVHRRLGDDAAVALGARQHAGGLIVRMVGDSAEAARALGYSPTWVRLFATCFGGFMAGVGGSFLSLYYPGSWNEGLSSGQGITAVALVIFARWNPLACFGASLLFGGAGALGPALQAVGVTSGAYLLNAAPYVLTLVILVLSSSSRHRVAGAPGELSVTK